MDPRIIRNSIILLAFLGVLAASFFLPVPNKDFPNITKQQIASVEQRILTVAPIKQKEYPPQITASGAIALDLLHETILFEKESDTKIGIASLTKILTALVALDKTHWEDVIPISEYAVQTEGVTGNLRTGEHFYLKDLIAMMLIESSNDAASAIAQYIGGIHGADSPQDKEALFVIFMNKKARDLGLTNTNFTNPTGLDMNEEAGIPSNTSTPKDMARLVVHTIKNRPELWNISGHSVYTITSQEGFKHKLANTNYLISRIPGVVAGKTGFTDTAGGALITLAEIPLGSKTVIIILGSSINGRFEDTQNIISWLRE